MYRKSSGKIGFRPFQIFNDFPGSLSSSSGADPGHISNVQQDSVYLYQLQLPNPCALTEETLYVSKIIDHESVSRKVFQQLKKLDLLTVDNEVTTAAFGNPTFGKEFTHSLAMIPASRQKHIVDFLFWWDDETRRLHKLFEEKQELTVLRASSQDAARSDYFQLLLDRLQLKIQTRPSQRNAEIEQDKDLPNIEAAAMGKAETGGSLGENPPAYS